jgi:cbb3-type cytochrome oxidase subunit 1
LFLVGALIMAFNVWRTILPRKELATAIGLAAAE